MLATPRVAKQESASHQVRPQSSVDGTHRTDHHRRGGEVHHRRTCPYRVAERLPRNEHCLAGGLRNHRFLQLDLSQPALPTIGSGGRNAFSWASSRGLVAAATSTVREPSSFERSAPSVVSGACSSRINPISNVSAVGGPNYRGRSRVGLQHRAVQVRH